MPKHFDIIIIGGGIIGLSTAYHLVLKYPNYKILILEKENQIAKHQTGNNSGVIHSGIYYKPGSEKAKNCLRGYRQMLDFCDVNKISYELCGKIIVQSEESETKSFENIYNRGIENGLQGLKILSKEEAKEIEPHVVCKRAILVPQTGIVDYKKVAQKLLDLFINQGGEILYNNKVIGISLNGKEKIINTIETEFSAKYIVNCAGLYSDKITQMNSKNNSIQIIPFRGEYYELNDDKKFLVKNLIYPVPNPEFPFLGVHFTRMIDGKVEAGPNAVLAFKREGYSKWDINLKELYDTISFSGFRKIAYKYRKEGWEEIKRSYSKKLFVNAMQKIIPEINESDVKSGGAGVRAQACSEDGNLFDDFVIVNKDNIINVINAPSPAATSSLSIGEFISNQIL